MPGNHTKAGTIIYRASQHDCGACLIKQLLVLRNNSIRPAFVIGAEARSVLRDLCSAKNLTWSALVIGAEAPAAPYATPASPKANTRGATAALHLQRELAAQEKVLGPN